jgi:WD40 repeat protein
VQGQCRGGNSATGGGMASAGGAAGGSSTSGGVAGGDATGGGGGTTLDVVAVEIDPMNPTITTTPGNPATRTFTASLKLRDGSTLTTGIVPSWTTASRQYGDIDAVTGEFRATGAQGGTTMVTATVVVPGSTMPMTGSTNVTVQISRTFSSPNFPQAGVNRFGTLMPFDPQQSANLVYPLDRAVMPQNVFAADLQWLNGAPGDLFRVTLRKPNVEVLAFLEHTGSFTNSWLVDSAAWRSFAQTNPDADGVITVDRWVAATQTAYRSNEVKVRFARAALSGSVYYWAVNEGRVYRIDDGTNQRVSFMPTPPPVPQPGNPNQQEFCIGCHTVSPSGRYMAGRLGGGDNFGTVFDLTTDLSGSPPPSLFSTNLRKWWFSSWSPREDRLVVTTGPSPTGFSIIDPMTGALVPAGGSGLPSNNVTHPAWSPDGTAIACVSNVADWGVDYTDGTISLIPVTGMDTFGPMQSLLSGSAASIPNRGTLRAPAYPVWTPDSQRLVFSVGVSARSSTQPAKLYAMRRDGSDVRELVNANGGQELSFEPRMSPFDSGGYFWLAFLSRRDYGNAAAGTRGANREQIWVTAIKKNPMPGEDPSEVGYWLPGQSAQSRNISAYWAARACRPTGQGCSVNSECCTNECRPPAGGGAPVCSPPPPNMCRIEGQTCSMTSDCCMGLTCNNNVCGGGIN